MAAASHDAAARMMLAGMVPRSTVEHRVALYSTVLPSVPYQAVTRAMLKKMPSLQCRRALLLVKCTGIISALTHLG